MLANWENIALTLGIGGLILFMVFIVWNLAKESEAGVFGTWILFGVLGLGVLGFIIKVVITELLERSVT